MSTKIAIVIGDYSNGWSDSIVVQTVSAFKNMATLNADRSFVMEKMNEALVKLTGELEANAVINPKDPALPCCDGFEAWFKDKESKFCGLCGTPVVKERREAFKY